MYYFIISYKVVIDRTKLELATVGCSSTDIVDCMPDTVKNNLEKHYRIKNATAQSVDITILSKVIVNKEEYEKAISSFAETGE